MSSVYRERISDERRKAVSDHVRQWLFGGVRVERYRCAIARNCCQFSTA